MHHNIRPSPSSWTHQAASTPPENDVNCEFFILNFLDKIFLPFAQKRLHRLLVSTRDMTLPVEEENNHTKNNDDDIFRKIPKKRSKKTPFRSLFDPNFRAVENVPLEAALAGK